MKSKRLTASLLAFMMVFTSFGTVAFAETPNTPNTPNKSNTSDVSGHWAENVVEKWTDGGVINGYEDGTFRPDKGITRAEFIKITNGLFGFKETGTAGFSDVSEGDWYAGEVKKAVYEGFVSGYEDGKFKPNNGITRQEAAMVISSIMDREGTETIALSGFGDKANVPDWSRSALTYMVQKGYLSGYPDKTLRPASNITRAETLAMLDRVAGAVYGQAGVYGRASGSETIYGNVSVTVDGVTIRNTIIKGDLHITAGVGDGEATFEGVTVEGETIVNGGGISTVSFEDSRLQGLEVSKRNGRVRILIIGNTDVDWTNIKEGVVLDEENPKGNGYGRVEIIGAQLVESVVLRGEYDQVIVDASVNLIISAGCTIKNLVISNGAQRTHVTGNGYIDSVQIKTKDVVINPKVGEVILDDGVESAEIDGETLTESRKIKTSSSHLSNTSVAAENVDQAAPTGLAGLAPTSALNDGEITGTTIAMEYRLKGATDFIAVAGLEIIGLSEGTYEVRLAAKAGYNAGEVAEVTVPAYVEPNDNDASLSGLTIDGIRVAGFNATRLEYNVEIAAGTTAVPTVVATVNNTDKANAVVTVAAALPGATTVLVTAEDGTTTETYTINFTVAPVQGQVAPTGLAGLAPTSALNDGKITGTKIAMEYKLTSADDDAYTTCSASETIGLSEGTYEVRLAAKVGYNAGEVAEVTVPAYVAPKLVTGIIVTSAGDVATMLDGATLAMSAAVTPTNATDQTIAWRVATLSSGTAIIDASTGILTATGATGIVTVTARNVASGVSGTKDIMVLTEADQEAADKIAAAEVDVLIDLLQGAEDLFQDAKNSILDPNQNWDKFKGKTKDARVAYDALTDSQKASVVGLKTLEDAEAVMAGYESMGRVWLEGIGNKRIKYLVPGTITFLEAISIVDEMPEGGAKSLCIEDLRVMLYAIYDGFYYYLY